MFVETIMLHCYTERSLSLSVTMSERDREITTKRYVLHTERLQQKKRKIISMCSCDVVESDELWW